MWVDSDRVPSRERVDDLGETRRGIGVQRLDPLGDRPAGEGELELAPDDVQRRCPNRRKLGVDFADRHRQRRGQEVRQVAPGSNQVEQRTERLVAAQPAQGGQPGPMRTRTGVTEYAQRADGFGHRRDGEADVRDVLDAEI
jgi:hypothetical protein